MVQILGGVVGADGGDAQTGVEPRKQRLVCRVAEAVLEFGQADEDNREQSLRVPLVVEQDVKVAEHVLMQQVGLVQKQDGVDAVA